MISKRIIFKDFKIKKKKNFKTKIKLQSIIKGNNHILQSLSKNYKDSFSIEKLKNFKRKNKFRIIGMGGSILGTQAIYDFLNHKVKKKFFFTDNLSPDFKKEKDVVNLVVSKSGNTIETIVNANILIKKKQKNIFITENKKNYLYLLAEKMKSEIIHHNNFIGGRYSVLSEVGMLPAELMGLDYKKFRQFNLLIKNKNFFNSLISSVNSSLLLIKKKKFNSIIINYDEKSENLFKWYQQLIAESLGKKKKGILPIISNMPKDNHSVMQLYLDGFQNNFFTFFYVNENKSYKINNKTILPSKNFLRNKNLLNIIYAQKKATERVFDKKKIPFRSFEVKKRDEQSLGELFSFFMLETILLGKCLGINPYDQPAVELIKKETMKILI